MKLIRNPSDLYGELQRLRKQGKTVGFVPTMGALHEGHLSLCRSAVADNDIVVTSIFVNPMQFSQGEDFKKYPRSVEADSALLDSAGVDILFIPQSADMYPAGFQTDVQVADLSEPLEGQCRPGHFKGVATVVLKFFNMVGPCIAYFGEKDYQQLLVIQRMVKDLNVPVEVHPMPIVRELDGVAMSSRNRYLSQEERQAAPCIYQALCDALTAFNNGVVDTGILKRQIRNTIAFSPLLRPEYIEVVDVNTLVPIHEVEAPAVVLVAVRISSARLIDNIRLNP